MDRNAPFAPFQSQGEASALLHVRFFAKDQDNPPSPQTMSLFRTRIAQSSATGWTESPAIGRSDTSATPVRRASTTKSVGSSVRLTASETGNTSNSKSTNSQRSTKRNHYDFLSETVEEAFFPRFVSRNSKIHHVSRNIRFLPNILELPSNQGKKVVHPAGLEPTTYCSGGSRSIQMSYGCTV